MVHLKHTMRLEWFLLSVLLLNQTAANFTDFMTHQLTKLKTVYASNLEKTVGRCEGAGSVKSQVLQLINFIGEEYLRGCVTVIMYEKAYELESENLNFDLQRLLIDYPSGHINVQISRNLSSVDVITPRENRCRNYILLIQDIESVSRIVGNQIMSKVVVVTTSTRWSIEEFLQSVTARGIVNLLIISNSGSSGFLIAQEEVSSKPRDINLYTHALYTDPSGSGETKFLTAWRCSNLTRNIQLFPSKLSRFNGRQFVVAASEQPPYAMKGKMALVDEDNQSQLWDGLEIRILRTLAKFLNYSIEIKEAMTNRKGGAASVVEEVVSGNAEIGVSGVFTTREHLKRVTISSPHSVDCAVFITRTSTALPRYRAIFGPFHWSVWVAVIITYLMAIILIYFSDNLSLIYLFKNPWHLETMFWYVFGTFTNLFTFAGKHSWSKTERMSSRLFIGWYWCFSIILTACYTGSIVSFITLFVFPELIEGVDQLAKANYRIGSLLTEGWGSWFNNSDHKKTKWLLRDLELIPNTTEGLKNVTRSIFLPMFRPYAFLAGRAEMEYIVQANYTLENKKDVLHITKDCFAPFSVGFVFPAHAVYATKFNEYILRVQQSGIGSKLMSDVKWLYQRTSTGKLLQAGSGTSLREVLATERKLTLDDMQGMYLLMGVGYLIALIVLIVECLSRNKKTWASILLSLEPWINLMHRARSAAQSLYHTFFKQPIIFSPEISTYRKYDSRVLNCQRKVWHRSEVILRKRGGFEAAKNTSLPNIPLELRDTRANGVKTPYPKSPAPGPIFSSSAMTFGSVSSLPWDLGYLSTRPFDISDDRAQSNIY